MGDKKNYIALLFASTFLSALGQLLFKYGFNTPSEIVTWIAAGFIAYAISTIVYFVVLSRVSLSWAYGIGGFSYIFATLFASYVLLENVPLLRWVGVGVIFIGVILIGIS